MVLVNREIEVIKNIIFNQKEEEEGEEVKKLIKTAKWLK